MKMTIYLTLGAMLSLLGLIAIYVKSGAHSFDLIALRDDARGPAAGRGDAEAHLRAAPVRLRHPGLALALPFLGAARLRGRTEFGRDAPRRRPEEVRAVRTDPDCPAAPAPGGPRTGAIRLAAPGRGRQRARHRSGHDGAARPEADGRIQLGHAHGLRVSGRCHRLAPGRRRGGAAHGGARPVGGASVPPLDQHPPAHPDLRPGEMGGLAQKAPVLAAFFVAATFASIGLPGFANFWGELADLRRPLAFLALPDRVGAPRHGDVRGIRPARGGAGLFRPADGGLRRDRGVKAAVSDITLGGAPAGARPDRGAPARRASGPGRSRTGIDRRSRPAPRPSAGQPRVTHGFTWTSPFNEISLQGTPGGRSGPSLASAALRWCSWSLRSVLPKSAHGRIPMVSILGQLALLVALLVDFDTVPDTRPSTAS